MLDWFWGVKLHQAGSWFNFCSVGGGVLGTTFSCIASFYASVFPSYLCHHRASSVLRSVCSGFFSTRSLVRLVGISGGCPSSLGTLPAQERDFPCSLFFFFLSPAKKTVHRLPVNLPLTQQRLWLQQMWFSTTLSYYPCFSPPRSFLLISNSCAYNRELFIVRPRCSTCMWTQAPVWISLASY